MDSSDIIAGSVVGLGVICIAAIALFIGLVLGAFLGALSGWFLSLTPLGNWIIEGFKVFGLDATGKLVDIGAMLGFVSGYFKHTISAKK